MPIKRKKQGEFFNTLTQLIKNRNIISIRRILLDKQTQVSVQEIYKSYSSVPVLKGVSLEVNKGEVHALLGENGAGKSTLMNIISGVTPANKGRIILDGQETHFRNPDDAQRSGIGFVHQELALCPHVTVADNIFIHRLPSKNGMVNRAKLNAMAREALEPFDRTIRPEQKLSELSVAKQQLVEIAKALSLHCKVLIFDEPTSSLNEAEAKSLFDVIRSIKSQGISVLYISHKLSEMFEICDRVTVLRDGLVIGTHNVSDITAESVISEMVGKELTSMFPPKSGKVGEPIFQVADYTSKHRFSHISFDLKKGEILGISGLVGAGRSEAMRAICGIDRCETGSVRLHGTPLKFRSYHAAISHGVCYLTENRKLDGLFLGMSITKNMIAIIFQKMSKHGLIQNRDAQNLTEEYRKKLNIKFADQKQKIQNLSGGNQQKVLIAKLLVSNPEVIIMDEPTRGIDVGAKTEIHTILRELCNQGMGVIVISSELPEVVGLCDRVMVMHEGKMVGELCNEKVTQDDIIEKISVNSNHSGG